MKILSLCYNPFLLSGGVRVHLMLMDFMKSRGHTVKIAFCPEVSVKEVPELKFLEVFHPIEHLKETDFIPIQLPQGYPYARYEMNKLRAISKSFDTLFTEHTVHYRMREVLPMNHIHYLHYPHPGLRPDPDVKILCNSQFTADAAEKEWGKKLDVLYPPIPLWRYEYFRELPKEYDICVYGRIHPAKLTYLKVIQKYNPLIMGSGYISNKYMESPQLLLMNGTFMTVCHYMAKSRMYIHMKEDEHFGISVTEAMALGLPVIVHRSGGPYIDITEGGKYGLTYSNEEELLRAIRLLNTGIYREYRDKSLERCELFSMERNGDRIEKLLS